jgi:hypothetical protein
MGWLEEVEINQQREKALKEAKQAEAAAREAVEQERIRAVNLAIGTKTKAYVEALAPMLEHIQITLEIYAERARRLGYSVEVDYEERPVYGARNITLEGVINPKVRVYNKYYDFDRYMKQPLTGAAYLSITINIEGQFEVDYIGTPVPYTSHELNHAGLTIRKSENSEPDFYHLPESHNWPGKHFIKQVSETRVLAPEEMTPEKLESFIRWVSECGSSHIPKQEVTLGTKAAREIQHIEYKIQNDVKPFFSPRFVRAIMKVLNQHKATLVALTLLWLLCLLWIPKFALAILGIGALLFIGTVLSAMAS